MPSSTDSLENGKSSMPAHVAVIGMGYVGLTLAIVLAESGYMISGVEKNPELLKNLAAGEPHVQEKDLTEMYRRLLDSGQISLGKNLAGAASATVFIITVGTPLKPDGKVNLDMLREATDMIASVLKDGDLVILRSTVTIGATRKIVLPALKASGKTFYLAFCPERTLEGNALRELHTLPQIIGGLDHESTCRAAALFEKTGVKPVQLSSPEAAEMAKIACNAQRDLQFAFANELALLCENFNIDANEVVEAANHDYPRARISKPGPVGGPCLGKDIYILAQSMEKGQEAPQLMLAARHKNEYVLDHALSQIASIAKPVKKISLLGLAFKGSPPTGDIRGSIAIRACELLRSRFPEASLSAFDALATREEVARYGLPAPEALETALENADIVLILNNHSSFSAPEFQQTLTRLAPEAYVYDFWNMLPDGTTLGPRNVLSGLGRITR